MHGYDGTFSESVRGHFPPHYRPLAEHARHRSQGSLVAAVSGRPLMRIRTQMMHAGPWGDAGKLISIELSDSDTPSTIKMKLVEPTGIPASNQKLMLGAFR